MKRNRDERSPPSPVIGYRLPIEAQLLLVSLSIVVLAGLTALKLSAL